MPSAKDAAQGRKGLSLTDFIKETVTGAVTGGLAGATFYGAGKAVEALKESIKGVSPKWEV